MRKYAIITIISLAAACSQAPAANTDEPESGSTTATTANGSPPGTYYIAAADGTASLVTMNADGTYSQITPEGTFPAQGTFEVVDGETCFKVHQVGAEPTCYTETARAEDGSYIATPDGGEPLTVQPYTAADVSLAN